jgi:hypothetical protein
MPVNGCTVWSPFDANTAYFAPSEKGFTVNFVVDDLDEALKQVSEAGGQIVGTIEEYETGALDGSLIPTATRLNSGSLFDAE